MLVTASFTSRFKWSLASELSSYNYSGKRMQLTIRIFSVKLSSLVIRYPAKLTRSTIEFMTGIKSYLNSERVKSRLR